jgi:aspartate/methionine/tyrosine aminotransferase
MEPSYQAFADFTPPAGFAATKTPILRETHMDVARLGWFPARMDLSLSSRIRATGAPPIPAVRGWAARYQGGAGPVLDMTQAVPGYPPHADLLARLASAAGDATSAGYGPIEGEDALREALATDMARAYQARIGAGDIAITAGGNLAFTLAMMTLAGAGDAVMLPAPWYFNHRMALEALGIPCRVLPCAGPRMASYPTQHWRRR